MELDSFLISKLEEQKKHKRLIVVGKNDAKALAALKEVYSRGWVEPVLCGNSFTGWAESMEHEFDSYTSKQAREKALGLLDNGEAEGIIYTGPLDGGFFKFLTRLGYDRKSNSLLSYLSVFLTPKEGHLTFLTDTLFNPSPSLNEKIAIVQNAIEVAHCMDIERPLIAALAPLELVNPAIPSTLDAAIISKMAERTQFGEAVVEGPLAMDNAESASAALTKGITSPVPGHVDIYLFPDLESANITAQFISWTFPSKLGGVIAGTPFPVIVLSPLESPDSWLSNIALGLLL